MKFFYKDLKLADIEIDESVEDINRTIANIFSPSLDKLNLTPKAVELAIAMSPVIGWQVKAGKYTIIGGLRSLYLAQQLDEMTHVPVLIVPKNRVPNPEIFAVQSALIELITRAVDRRCSLNVIPLLWDKLQTKEHRGQLSPKFVSKTGISDAAGINRREFAKIQETFHSEFLAYGRDV